MKKYRYGKDYWATSLGAVVALTGLSIAVILPLVIGVAGNLALVVYQILHSTVTWTHQDMPSSISIIELYNAIGPFGIAMFGIGFTSIFITGLFDLLWFMLQKRRAAKEITK